MADGFVRFFLVVVNSLLFGSKTTIEIMIEQKYWNAIFFIGKPDFQLSDFGALKNVKFLRCRFQ